MVSVEIYTTPTCHFCHLAKDFFVENGVSYIEYNVGADAEKRQEMITKTGQLGVPVIVVGGMHTIVGFNEPRLRELLGLSGNGPGMQVAINNIKPATDTGQAQAA